MSDQWPSLAELEQLASAETGRDFARERREDEETMRLLDEIEEIDAERAADEIERLAWKDDFGRPIPGHESPRFLDWQQRQYRDWLLSSEGRRTLENAHPELAARLRRQERSESRSFDEVR